MSVKCRKCRHDLASSDSCKILSAHGEIASSAEASCSSEQQGIQDTLWFLDENSVPWILEEINKTEWTKGKLNCPKCGARVGSFDFVSSSKCSCGSSLLPSVHFVRSKVDRPLSNSISQTLGM